MSTAILLSGQLRSFARCYPTQRWHVLRHFADPHFFLTIQDQHDVDEILRPLVKDYGADRVHLQQLTDPDLTADLTPQLSAAYHQAPYANAAPAHRLLLQHYYQAKVWEHFQTACQEVTATQQIPRLDENLIPNGTIGYQRKGIDCFNTIIRLRPDLYFHSLELPTSDLDWLEDEVLTPWWGRFGGLNDRFAIMGPQAARAYFDVYSKISELLANGCPFHPETLLAARLEMANLSVSQTLRAEFSTLRTDGTSRPPEISPIDLAHAALRAS